MKQFFLLPITLLGFCICAFAQAFLPSNNVQSKTPTDLRQLEQHFQAWSKERNLEEEKGWKWYARWLEEQSSRTNADGSLSDQTELFRAAIEKVAVEKSKLEKRSPNWMPAGPNDYARIVTSYIIRGMGRINCITFHPSDPQTFWVGVAQGGIWKTTNGGASWLPLNEGLPILRISDIAINPNNPDEMYASVGDYAYLGISLELDDRKRHTHYGMGVYKSTDGGRNWSATGLSFEQSSEDASLTRRVFVHHENNQRLLAAGIFGIKISLDGGATWTTISNEIVRDIEQHPSDPSTLYMATSTVRNLEIGRSAIWKSTDFGQTWMRLNTGIPAQSTVYRIELALSRSNPDYVYAIATNRSGGMYGLYRTTDAGENWELRSTTPNVLHWFDGNRDGGQGSYDLTIVVHPDDPDKIYTGGINIWGSEDGGRTWRIASYWVGAPDRVSIHADQHFLAYNPLDQKFYACNDGGVSRASEIVLGDESATDDLNAYSFQTDWEDIAGGMQITSFYRIGLSESKPGDFIAGTQDNSSWLKKDGAWTGIIGGDGMEGLIHPENPNIIYGSSQFGNISRSTDGGNFFRNISRNIPDDNEPAAWTTPFMLHPQNLNAFYAAYTNLYKSEDGGDRFFALSDFPRTGQATSSFAISESDSNYIYLAHRIVHSLDEKSKMWRTLDGGNTWQNVTAGLPNDLFFTYVAVDDDNPLLVWVVTSGFSEGQKVYRSEDGGNTWENISYNLPNIPVNCIVQDPNSINNTVYIGTDLGVFYSQDNLREWLPYNEGLPNVIVSELEILASENKLYAATFGRGIWEGDLLLESVNTETPSIVNLSAQVSPNPNDGYFQLQLDGLPINVPVAIEIVDIMGRRLLEKALSISATSYSEAYDLDLAYGLYFLNVKMGTQRKVVRFVVE